MINQRKIITIWLMVIPTLLFFYAGLWAAIFWWYPHGLSKSDLYAHIFNFSLIYILWLVTFLSFRIFDRETFRRHTTLFFSLVSAMSVNLVLAVGYFYFQPKLLLTPRRFLMFHIGISLSMILIWNFILKWFVFSRLIQPVYLFSPNNELNHLNREIEENNYLGYKVAGYINESNFPNLKVAESALIIFPDTLNADPKTASTIFTLRNYGVNFINHSAFYEKLWRRIYLPLLNESWFLQNVTYGKKIFYGLAKKTFDLLAGLILLALFLIVFPIVSLITKLFYPGPILFSQERIGKGGKTFMIYKFRTMSHGTTNHGWTMPNDQRITRFGRFLRLIRLDELPQCINLLKGNISIVGPRPEQVGIVADLKNKIPFYEERHLVAPGITGWAQLNVYAATIEETKLKLEYDLYYIKHQSLIFDLEIIIKTIYSVLFLNGK